MTGKCTNSVASGWAPIASQQLDITLAPGEDEDPMSSLLGYVENPEDEKFEAPTMSLTKNRANAMLARYQTDADVEKAFAELNTYWENLLIQIRSRILQ